MFATEVLLVLFLLRLVIPLGLLLGIGEGLQRRHLASFHRIPGEL